MQIDLNKKLDITLKNIGNLTTLLQFTSTFKNDGMRILLQSFEGIKFTRITHHSDV